MTNGFFSAHGDKVVSAASALAATIWEAQRSARSRQERLPLQAD